MHNYKMFLTVPAISLALAGCALRTQTTGMAVEYNEFVAQTTNRQTVLNILRAREREPMHFTSFSLVRGTVRGQANAELGASLAPDTTQAVVKTIAKSTTAAGSTLSGSETTREDTLTSNDNGDTLSPKVALQVSTGTDFDIAVNATDDFYRGVLGPLKESVVVHFLRQGFPPDLLSHLVIGELRFYAVFKRNGKDINDKGQEWKPGEEKYGHSLVAVIKNAPDEPSSAKEFKAAMDCRELSYVTDRRDKRSVSFGALAELSAVQPELIGRVNSEAAAPQIYKYNIGESSDFRLALSEPRSCAEVQVLLTQRGANRVNEFAEKVQTGGKALDAERSRTPAESVSPARSYLRSKSIGAQSFEPRASASEGLTGSGTYEFESKDYFKPLLKERGVSAEYSGDLVIELTLRSVEGVLYYLGEYVRDPALSPKLYGRPCARDTLQPCIPVIRVEPKGALSAEALAEVTYRGRKYVAPLSGSSIGVEAGRSSQTISLVQQLLNLHRTSKDLPVTPVVRVAN